MDLKGSNDRQRKITPLSLVGKLDDAAYGLCDLFSKGLIVQPPAFLRVDHAVLVEWFSANRKRK
jgi:hypothetical protein